MKTFPLPIIILLCTFNVVGQNTVSSDASKAMFTEDEGYHTFENITTPFGGNTVNVLCQDAQGMMWVGTKKGLFSYDGHNARQFLNEGGSAGNEIFAIEIIGWGYLAIGTDSGLLWFNLKEEKFEDVPPELKSLGAIRSLSYHNEVLWIGTRDNGLYGYETNSNTLQKSIIDGTEETRIYALEQAGDKLFVGSYECLSSLDPVTNRRQRIQLPGNQRLMVNSLLWDGENSRVWIGTEGYLFWYDIENETLEQDDALVGNSYKSLNMDNAGSILLGTDAGLFVYNPVSGKCMQIVHDTRTPQSLGSNVIWDIVRDKNGNIWLATDRGVSLTMPKTYYRDIRLSEIVPTGEGNLFSCMLKDTQGELWMGGENGLIHVSQKEGESKIKWFRNNDRETPLSHNRIRGIYEDRDNIVWIASDGGVARYDRQECRFVYYTIQDKTGNRNANWAYDMYEDELGHLWIATYLGGLIVVDKTELIQKGNKEPFTDILHLFDEGEGLSNIIYKIQPDEESALWLNTQDGLACIDIQKFEIRWADNVFMDNMIYNNGAVWYSTEGQIFKYDIERKESTPIFKSDRQIYAFLKERDKIWFSSTSGVSYIELESGQVVPVLKSDKFYQAGCYSDQDNVILWGGEDNITYLSLDNVGKQEYSDSVFITSVLLDGKILEPKKGLRGISPRYDSTIRLLGRGNISIDLSSYTYFHPNGESFSYRIGREGKWQALEEGQNRISIVDMPGGKYTLQLSNVNPEQDRTAVISTYRICIPYHWYSAPISYVIYTMLLLMVIIGLVKDRQAKSRRRYEQREREKSLELSKLKTDFFVNISHELKTPLSLIIAPLGKLISETTNNRQKEALLSIQKNSLKLNELIYKILDFKQIDYESENSLIRSHVELNSLLQNCVRSFYAVAKERDITLTVEVLPEPIWLNLDILKIESVIANLISNAVKYVDNGTGRVEVALRHDKERVIMSVSDNGSGFREEEIPFVFIRFFQGKNKEKQREGTGIGLYLSRKYVELHGGEIKAMNNRGGGATLEVNIPIEGENEISTESAIQEEVSDSKEATLLIVDDNQEMVSFLTEALSDRYVCLKAYNGKEALKVLEDRRPDLVIVDQMMPVMDGFEFVRQTKRGRATTTTPIIMLTAKDDMETELRSIKMGIDAFISKPFDIKEVTLRIAQLLHKRESMEESARMDKIVKPELNVENMPQPPDEVLMEKIVRTIEDNMGREDFNVGMLAEMVGITPKQLYRKVKQLTGTTPVNYLRKLRMKMAATLLSQKKFTVSETMYLVGYSNASYFAKCFSEEFGLSPKAFIEKERDRASEE